MRMTIPPFGPLLHTAANPLPADIGHWTLDFGHWTIGHWMYFVKESLIHATRERVFAFHEQDNALELLLPPWESARVIQRATIADIGSRAIIETNILGPLRVRWIAEHTRYEPPHLFEDVQIKGPFRSWRHRHTILGHPEGATLRDEIEYEPPFPPFGKILAPLLIERRLRRLFNYRHQVTRLACEAWQC